MSNTSSLQLSAQIGTGQRLWPLNLRDVPAEFLRMHPYGDRRANEHQGRTLPEEDLGACGQAGDEEAAEQGPGNKREREAENQEVPLEFLVPLELLRTSHGLLHRRLRLRRLGSSNCLHFLF